jgi:hypothetical protein
MCNLKSTCRIGQPSPVFHSRVRGSCDNDGIFGLWCCLYATRHVHSWGHSHWPIMPLQHLCWFKLQKLKRKQDIDQQNYNIILSGIILNIKELHLCWFKLEKLKRKQDIDWQKMITWYYQKIIPKKMELHLCLFKLDKLQRKQDIDWHKW